MIDENAAQSLADAMLTDPDKDASGTPPPAPPQTIEAEPTSDRPVPPADVPPADRD